MNGAELETPRRAPPERNVFFSWGRIRRDILLIPNLITIGRILLVAPIILLFNRQGATAVTALALILATAYLSDYFDGYFARRLNQESALGMILDPVADKLWTMVLLVLLCLYRDFPLWMAVLFIGRDVAILTLNLIALIRCGQVIESGEVGRKYLVIIGLMMILVALRVEQAVVLGYILAPMAMVIMTQYSLKFHKLLKLQAISPNNPDKGNLRKI